MDSQVGRASRGARWRGHRRAAGRAGEQQRRGDAASRVFDNNGTAPFTERWPPWRLTLAYDAGLLFLTYQKDPRTSFIPVNRKPAFTDAMSQFISHTATGIFAIPPGARGEGDWIGAPLFA
ncbi:hypothetical protein [Nocardia sp. NPDC004123]